MPGPTLTFGFVFATLLGAGFHLLLGGDVRRLAIFLLCGWCGFAAGHFTGVLLDASLMNVGALHFLPATFMAVILLIFAQALTSRRRTSR